MPCELEIHVHRMVTPLIRWAVDHGIIVGSVVVAVICRRSFDLSA